MEQITQEKLASIEDKIKKLYAKAASTDSMEEANTCTALANKLLLQYNLDLTKIDLKNESERQKVNIVEDWHNLNGELNRHESNWVHDLYVSIARYNLCRAFSYGVDNTGVNFQAGNVLIIGEPFNVELVKFIVEQLISKVRIIENGAWKVYTGELKRNSFKRGFFNGAVIGINQRLREDREELERKARQAASEENQMMGMIHIKANDVDKYLKERNEKAIAAREEREALMKSSMSDKELVAYEKRKKKEQERIENLKGRNKELKGQEARYEGYKAGKSITINKGVENNKTSGQLD